ncbi:acyltransferase family protein, partial [Salinispira pacifica]
WFAVALLIFSAVYAGGRYALSRIAPPRKGKGSAAGRRSDFTNAAAVAAILVIGVVTFLVRTVQPIGTSVLNMQLCFFTQYIVLFAAGVWAGRRNVIERVSTRFGMHWLKLSLAAGIPAWFLIGGLGGAVSGSMESFTAAMAGGWHWQAAAMAMWESFFCVSFSIGLLVLYRDRVNTRGRLSAFLSANAFGVYVFHTPVLVTISLLLRAVALPALPKTAVVMTLAVVVSFLFAAAVRRVPGLRKVFA